MDKLSREEVMHVANLAKINVSEEEILNDTLEYLEGIDKRHDPDKEDRR